jgi:uncharacterized protein (TIGR03066 family)
MNRRIGGALLLALTAHLGLAPLSGAGPSADKDKKVRDLVEQLKSPDTSKARKAAYDLLALGTDAKSAVPSLLAFLKDKKRQPTVRAAVADALPFVGADAKTVAPALLAGTKERSSQLRCSCALALHKLDSKYTPTAVSVLTKALQNALDFEEPFTVGIAARALGEIGPKAKSAVPALQEAIQAGGMGAFYAREALPKIDPKAKAPGARDKKKETKALFKQEQLVGAWRTPASKEGPGGTATFTKDGRITLAFKSKKDEVKISGTYKIDGKKLRLTLKHGEEDVRQVFLLLRLTDTELTWQEADGEQVTFKKQPAKKD